MPPAVLLLHLLLFLQFLGAVAVLALQSLEFVSSHRLYYTGELSTDQPSIATLLSFLISGFSILASMVLVCLTRSSNLKVSSMDRNIGLAMTLIWIALVVILFVLERPLSSAVSAAGKSYQIFWLAVRVMAIFTATCWTMRTVIQYITLVQTKIISSSNETPSSIQPERPKWASQPSMSESLQSFSINDKHMNPYHSATSVNSIRRGDSPLRHPLTNSSVEDIPPLPKPAEGNYDKPPSTNSTPEQPETPTNTGNNEIDKHRSHIFQEMYTDRNGYL
ncbi:hypothetical protein K450DRAFT_217434 [Umbelopsis ramanniana AG]|uniref:Uncharacterized protein n=1 Tax=Umbelopsis ramanniana AG TaxID=1314678 RepID=A0AAD5HJS4_UMBRA|nr:uncharacterized protein K450DRAFT_217434 [Umbelopsis ramanniana AG]KAI8584673.1 hypothetical protein K450DRAFT_217434 [Umbelopsis ramanniana AG]